MNPLLNPAVHLRIVGICLLLLVGLNTLLPRYFHWRDELARLSLFTRQVFFVHAFFICLMLLFMAILSLFFAPLLLDRSRLAILLLAALALFWIVRVIFQFLVYSPRLWRGNRFNTAMHILFSCLWLYFAAVYAGACIFSLR